MFEALFLGYAIGDAFGAGVEFQDRNWIRRHVDFTRFVNFSMLRELAAVFQQWWQQNER